MNDAIGVFLLVEYNFICYNPNDISIIQRENGNENI